MREGSEKAIERDRFKAGGVGWVGKKALGDRANGRRDFEACWSLKWRWSVWVICEGVGEVDESRRGCRMSRKRCELLRMLPMEFVGYPRLKRSCVGSVDGEEGIWCVCWPGLLRE